MASRITGWPAGKPWAVLLAVACLTFAGAACSSDKAAGTTSDDAADSVTLPAKEDLPGGKWVLVGHNDYRQFDLPADLSNALPACKPAIEQQLALAEIQKGRADRSLRMYRSSMETTSVQVTFYAQQFPDADVRQSYLVQSSSVDQSAATLDCFLAANTSDDIKPTLYPGPSRISAPEGGESFSQEVVYKTPQGALQQRFEVYRWISGETVMTVQLVGPMESLTEEFLTAVLAITEQRLAE